MGFLQQDTANIIVDAVLTDIGRKKLAEGNFRVIKFAAGDDEVDYGMIPRYGRTVGQEKIEKNTPVFEGSTNNKFAQTYTLVSLPDPNRYTMPALGITATSGLSGKTLSLGTGTTRSQTVTISQTLTNNETFPPELVDNTFLVICDDRFLTVSKASPSIDKSRLASYVLAKNGADTTQGGATMSMQLNVRSISDSQFLIYGLATDKTVIRTGVRVVGMSSGSVLEFTVQITKNG
jgi:hypothetical protein